MFNNNEQKIGKDESIGEKQLPLNSILNNKDSIKKYTMIVGTTEIYMDIDLVIDNSPPVDIYENVMLKVNILNAKNIVQRNASAPDPYAVLYHGDIFYDTSDKKKTTSPVWNQCFSISIKQATEKTLIPICIFDKNLGKDEFLGIGFIPIAGVKNEPKKLTVKLKGSVNIFILNKKKSS